jgi:V8-like Glu-specific endopeptidase
MVCALQITGQNGLTVPGTGWLVGPRTVITAGHCVFDGPNLGGFAASIAVTPGRHGATGPVNTIPAVHFRTIQPWIDTASPDFDIGGITLASDVGSQLGFFGAAVRSAEQLKHHFAHVSGYPKDRGGGAVQFHDRQPVTGTTPRRLFYAADTSLGQSGAPVWIVDVAGGTPLVVGIHTYGIERTPANLQPANSATLITAEVLGHIQEWLELDRTM